MKVAGYIVSCDTCKKHYLRRESMKEPCLYCHGHSHWEPKLVYTPSTNGKEGIIYGAKNTEQLIPPDKNTCR